jgi:outer membrane protein W
MTVRITLLRTALVLVTPLVAAPLRAQAPGGVEYSAGTTRYRLYTTTRGSQTSPMGNQDFQIEARQQLTVNVSKPAKDTIVATVTLDSLSLKSAQMQQDVSGLVGSKFVTYLSPTGQFYSIQKSSNADPLAGQVTESVARFLPAYRRNLRTGLTWADTTAGKVTQQGMEVDRTVIANYKVLGDTAISGERAFKIERLSTVKAAGSGTAQGTPVALESATNSNAVIFLSAKGVYLGGQQNDDINVKITILAQNAEINIKQKAESKIEAIQ